MSFEQDLAAHIAPDNTRRLLALAGLYLVAYELVKFDVVDGVRGFFSFDWEADRGWTVDEQYRRDVTAGHPKELDACLSWLIKVDAISAGDADAVRHLRDERNRVAHEIGSLLADPRFEVNLEALSGAAQVLKRLAVFFGGIAVETDEKFDGRDVDYEGIESGASLLLQHVLAAFVADIASDYPDTPHPEPSPGASGHGTKEQPMVDRESE